MKSIQSPTKEEKAAQAQLCWLLCTKLSIRLLFRLFFFFFFVSLIIQGCFHSFRSVILRLTFHEYLDIRYRMRDAFCSFFVFKSRVALKTLWWSYDPNNEPIHPETERYANKKNSLIIKKKKIGEKEMDKNEKMSPHIPFNSD